MVNVSRQEGTFIPFAKPDIGEEEVAAVVDVLRSGWITTGQKALAFEKAFQEYLDTDAQTIAVNSATAGLHLALEAIGIGNGDEVILPSLTFTATAEVVRYLGGTPVLVDADDNTLNMSIDAVRAAVTGRTKAIVPVHYAGLACDMAAIAEIAREFGLRVVEDAAHALPTKYAGQLIGTFPSDVTVFSFYANKTMTTGEGGMIVTNDPVLASRMRVMRLHGIDRDAFDRFKSTTPAWYYEVVAPGYKYNLTDIAAALGLVQLKRLQSFQDRREKLARRYYDALAGLPIKLPSRGGLGDQHAWHLFVIRLTDLALERGIKRDELINRLSDEGIGTSVHYVPLHRQPYWRDSLNVHKTMFPVADQAYERMVSIPLFTAMSDADQEQVISALHRILG